MIALILARLAGWRGYALVAGLSLLLGFGSAWKLRDMMADHAKLKAVQHVLKVERKAADITQAAGERAEMQLGRIRVVTRTIVKEIPAHVTPEVDRSYPVPVGFVRVFNAAAEGRDVSEVPAPAGQPDDAPSGVALSAVAEATAENSGECLIWRQQLIDLQDFNRAIVKNR